MKAYIEHALVAALRQFVKAEEEWREVKGINADKFDDPLSDAYGAACTALAVYDAETAPPKDMPLPSFQRPGGQGE